MAPARLPRQAEVPPGDPFDQLDCLPRRLGRVACGPLIQLSMRRPEGLSGERERDLDRSTVGKLDPDRTDPVCIPLLESAQAVIGPESSARGVEDCPRGDWDRHGTGRRWGNADKGRFADGWWKGGGGVGGRAEGGGVGGRGGGMGGRTAGRLASWLVAAGRPSNSFSISRRIIRSRAASLALKGPFAFSSAVTCSCREARARTSRWDSRRNHLPSATLTGNPAPVRSPISFCVTRSMICRRTVELFVISSSCRTRESRGLLRK